MRCHEFVVDHRPCLILYVTVVRGRNITKGWADWVILYVTVVRGRNVTKGWTHWVDTPDPYVELKMRRTPDGRRQTATQNNEPNPEWNEAFRYLLDPEEKNILNIRLKDDNYTSDETLGRHRIDIADVDMDKWTKKTITLNKGVSEIDIEMKKEIDPEPTLRYSLDLCQEERDFVAARKLKSFEAMNRLLGSKGPQTADQVPTVAVIGSGGGFRAMVAYSGVFKALTETGVLDCTAYMGGLSGSSWLLSALCSHPKWPQMSMTEFQEELKNSIDSSLTQLLGLGQVSRYISSIMGKWNGGQPISFTDFFGHLVGEMLLKDRLNSKLTDQQLKVVDGKTPMPLYTGIHVKKAVSAQKFQEWVEFTPYEIGMAKFGAYMKTRYFGSKFFMGQLATKYDEPPLHYLQGIWGSAFCIMFNRLFEDNRNMDPAEIVRKEMEKKLEEEACLSHGSEDEADDDDDVTGPSPVKLSKTITEKNGEDGAQREEDDGGFWSNWIKGLVDSEKYKMLSTRTGRAGVIHNFLRGISLNRRNEDSKDANGQSNGSVKAYTTQIKTQHIIDGGLTFNSPYPLVLRQARGVELILSFDFSGRQSDAADPLSELVLAAKWAKHNGLSFPPIDKGVFEKEGMKELYIFRHPTDPHCPIVLHFVLVNMDFRKYKKPGVLRETTEEKEFADFSIFDDEDAPYSTYNFTYTHKAFDRLSKLMEFNTLNHLEEIKEAIAEAVQQKRK